MSMYPRAVNIEILVAVYSPHQTNQKEAYLFYRIKNGRSGLRGVVQ